ncbi:hypothetical protein GALL_536220 [mine drainage metagenome]|uniref:Uncharacterized protein n=1 Tax=mine drainage metagenome TaxID=410659 RepID=A0A1J5P187_9ZZZZ
MVGVHAGPGDRAQHGHGFGQAEILHPVELHLVPVGQQQIRSRIPGQGLAQVKGEITGGAIRQGADDLAPGLVGVRQDLVLLAQQIAHLQTRRAGEEPRHPRPARHLHHRPGEGALGQGRQHITPLKGVRSGLGKLDLLARHHACKGAAFQCEGTRACLKGQAPGIPYRISHRLPGPHLERHLRGDARVVPSAHPGRQRIVRLPVGLARGGIQLQAVIPSLQGFQGLDLGIQVVELRLDGCQSRRGKDGGQARRDRHVARSGGGCARSVRVDLGSGEKGRELDRGRREGCGAWGPCFLTLRYRQRTHDGQ